MKIGARVNRAIVSVDDGTSDYTAHMDGISGNSEIWLSGSGKITESTTMGAYVRWDIPKNQAGLSFGSLTGAGALTDGDSALDKYEYIYFKNAGMGTVSFGDIEPGADGTMNASYGGRAGDDGAVIGGVDARLSTGAFSGLEASTFVGIIDPAADANRVRYDSPSFGGLSVHGDLENDGGGSVGVKWSGKMGGLSVKAGAGMENAGNGNEMLGFSVAGKHASGLHAAINYGQIDADNSDVDPEWRRAVIGYEASMNSLGKTNISVFLSEKDDEAVKGNEGEMVSVGIKQSLDSIGGNLILQYDNYSFENAAANDMSDIDALVFEMQFNF
jgi:hypothetical protein